MKNPMEMTLSEAEALLKEGDRELISILFGKLILRQVEIKAYLVQETNKLIQKKTPPKVKEPRNYISEAEFEQLA